MITILCFALVSLGALALFLTVGGLSFVPALLCALGVFLLLHFLFVAFFWVVSLTVPNDQPLKKQNAICRFGTGVGFGILRIYAGIRPQITGIELLPKDSRFLFVCNHRSMFDPIVVADRLRDYNIMFISKPANMKIPMGGRIVHAAGYLAIDRENAREAMKTIQAASDYLKNYICNIAVYPEGTRSKTREMLPFHAGSLKIAQKAGVPIVVACVHGSENIRRFRPFSGQKVFLDILEVIPAETVCALRTPALSDQIRARIQQQLDLVEGDA
jgi:1-acyl-sn-glycerol-3-phosphate acyltransferase